MPSHRITPPLAIAAAILAIAGGCAALHIPSPSMPSMTALTGPPAPPGTPAWWKKHKKKAIIVPGSGYQVAGVDGYFDSDGRPINARAAKVIDDKESKGILGDVKLKQQVANIKEQVGLGPNEQAAHLAYSLGENLFRYERYDDAAKKFKEAAAAWPHSTLEQDAWFYQAESYFYAERYPKATNTYEKLIREYPNSSHLDKIIARQFAMARYWDQYNQYNGNYPITPNFFDEHRPLFDTVGRAMKNYENIRLNDPTGPLADDAVMASANSYFLRGRYIDADEQYELLRKEYPRSEHQYDAHILGLQCKLRRYQGPAYDETPLKEGRELVKQLKIQFAGKLDVEQKSRLGQIDAQLARELAQRDFNMGKHFENIKEYGSARFYYAEVLKKHGNTPLAEDARVQLASLGGLPDRPTSRLEPLLNLVPQSSERTAIAQVPLIKDADLSIDPAATGAPQVANGPGQTEAETGADDTIRR